MPTHTIHTMYYTFHQNNIGGGFIQNTGVGAYLIIESQNAEEAQRKARAIACEFGAAGFGADRRWDYFYITEDEATMQPEIHGLPPEEYLIGKFRRNETAVVHHYCGKVRSIEAKETNA